MKNITIDEFEKYVELQEFDYDDIIAMYEKMYDNNELEFHSYYCDNDDYDLI
ncbi:MAG: hypothetical protein UIM53_00295 [Acutalibacteraceae bacterium]|nr:hypothetical protein [Acutalibacteraceae bacterium]